MSEFSKREDFGIYWIQSSISKLEIDTPAHDILEAFGFCKWSARILAPGEFEVFVRPLGTYKVE